MSDYGYDPVALDEIRARYERCDTEALNGCGCGVTRHMLDLHELATGDVPAMLREIQQLRNVILGQVTRD